VGFGERAVDAVLRGASGRLERFYAHVGGRPTALVLGWHDDQPALHELAESLSARNDVALCAVTAGAAHDAAFQMWSDPEMSLAAAYGAEAGTPLVVVLDPNLRVVGSVSGADLAARVGALLDAARHAGPPVEVATQAPVLLLSDALDPDLSAQLIALLEVGGSHPTGVETSAAGTRTERLDPALKVRRDRVVDDPDLLRELTSTIG
jgi:hypothetical protein